MRKKWASEEALILNYLSPLLPKNSKKMQAVCISCTQKLDKMSETGINGLKI